MTQTGDKLDMKSRSLSSTLITSSSSSLFSFDKGLEWSDTGVEIELRLTTLLYVLLLVGKYPRMAGSVGAVASRGAGSHSATGCPGRNPCPSPFK